MRIFYQVCTLNQTHIFQPRMSQPKFQNIFMPFFNLWTKTESFLLVFASFIIHFSLPWCISLYDIVHNRPFWGACRASWWLYYSGDLWGRKMTPVSHLRPFLESRSSRNNFHINISCPDSRTTPAAAASEAVSEATSRDIILFRKLLWSHLISLQYAS